MFEHYANWVKDIALTSTTGTLWVVSELGKASLAPTKGRWVSKNRIDSWIAQKLCWRLPQKAHAFSNLWVYVFAPIAVIGFLYFNTKGTSEFFASILCIGQAVTAAGSLGQLVKYTVGRARPNAHEGGIDCFTSFYSAHTSSAFALASAASIVIRELKPELYGFGLIGLFGMAAVTGYLRMAAYRHYVSDVIVGAMAGTLIGTWVPQYFH